MQRLFWAVVVPLIALALTLALVLPALWIPADPPPDAEIILKERVEVCRPESLEQCRYLLAISMVPCLLWLASAVLSVRGKEDGGHWWHSADVGWWILIVQLAVATFVVVMLVGQNVQVHAFISRRQTLRVLFQFAFLALLWRSFPRRWKAHLVAAFSGPGLLGHWGQWLRWRAPFWIALVYTGIELLPSFYHENSPRVDWAFSYHLSFIMNEFAAVLNGRTLRVDFFPQYQGLLAFLLAPWFRVVGLTATTFTASMAALSALGFLLFFWTFRQLTRDPWKALLLFLPFLWVSLAPTGEDPHNWFQRTNAFNYFMVGPIRYIGPWITAALLCWFLLQPSRRRMVALYFAATLAVLNNLDFGIPALGAALLSVLFSSEKGLMPGWRWVGQVMSGLAWGIGLAMGGYLLIIFLCSGRLPDLSMVLLFQHACARCGFFMLPMPALGWHWVFYLTFMAAVARAFFLRPRQRLLAGLLLFSGIFGCGAMAYYVGRSYWQCLVAVFSAWAFAFLLLAWSKWQEWCLLGATQARSASEGPSTPLRFGLVSILPPLQIGRPGFLVRSSPLPTLLIGFGYLMCWSFAGQTPNLRHEISRLTAPPEALWPKRAGLVQFVRAHAVRGEKVGMICPFGFVLSLKAGVDNVYPFAEGESLILKSQLDVVLRAFEQAKVRRIFGQVEGELAEEIRRRGFRPVANVEDFVLWERPQDEGETPFSAAPRWRPRRIMSGQHNSTRDRQPWHSTMDQTSWRRRRPISVKRAQGSGTGRRNSPHG